MTTDKDNTVGETYQHVIASPALVDGDEEWTHLAVVYDAAGKQLRLYVNGDLAASGAATLWGSARPLSVGRAWYTPEGGTGVWTDQWLGSIDDLQVYQGAMTSAQILILHEQQSGSDSDSDS
jgi:hypothetical protein